MSRLFPLFLGIALLAACASAPEAPPEAKTAEIPQAPAPEPEPVERPFPDDAIYPLLVAEFALRRGAYDTALLNYMVEARKLDDAGVARHTTHLAQFLDEDSDALEAVQLWLKSEPDNLEANSTAANLLSGMGRPLEALPHMVVIARAGHQANFPTLLQGYNQLPAEQQAELGRQLDKLTGEFPDDPGLLLTYALVSADSGDYPKALDTLQSLFRVEPEQQQALVLEARINLQQQTENPFAHIEKLLDEHPDNTDLRLEYARLLTNTDLDAARKQFEVLSSQSPNDAHLLLSLALITREAGDNAIARGYLERVLETGDRLDEAHYYLGNIAEDSGDSGAAIDEYKQVGDSRQYLAASQRIGELLLAQGAREDARDWYRQQRAAVPQRAEQLYGVEAEVLRSAGDITLAEKVLAEGIAAFPDSNSLRYARSLISQQQSDIPRMEEDLKAILARDPDNATALNALGYTLADQTDRLDEAFQLVSRALELSPGEPAILDSMGWVYYRRGDLDKAQEYLVRAYTEFPDPEVAAHLGEVLWVKGEHDKAKQVWTGGLLGNPDHPVLQATLRRFGIDPRELTPTPPPPAKPGQ